MKSSLIALIAAASFIAGMAAAGVIGYGPLAYISYHIISSTQKAGEVQIIPAYINLGNLTAGENGSVTALAALILNISSNNTYNNYTVKLLHSDKLQKDFSMFIVELKIGNNTVILTPENNSAQITLANGYYNVSILIIFQVSQNPQGDLNVYNEPLLIIHPAEEENS